MSVFIIVYLLLNFSDTADILEIRNVLVLVTWEPIIVKLCYFLTQIKPKDHLVKLLAHLIIVHSVSSFQYDFLLAKAIV